MIDAVALLKTYHAALNAFELATVQRMFAINAVYVSPGLNGEIMGREKIMAAMQEYFAEFSDQVSVDEEIEQLNDFEVRTIWSLQATSIKTRLHVSRRGEELVTFNSDSKITRVQVRDL
jgi:ketosteroid isomerase-like protein